MSIVSHLHQLFNAETCQSYIHHTSMHYAGRIGPCNGPDVRATTSVLGGRITYQTGLKRYRCKEKDCKRTFNDLTGTLLDGSKRSVIHWILATFLLCLSCSSRRIAKELGGHVRTGYRWC
jgi:transposase-like protein